MLAANLIDLNGTLLQDKFTKQQLFILDAGLFALICDELKAYFLNSHAEYLRLLKITNQMEVQMLDASLAKCVVNDIVSSGMYTLSGIACYTNTPEDVLLDITSGKNRDPSTTLFSRIIKLHQSIRPDLYRDILKKIMSL